MNCRQCGAVVEEEVDGDQCLISETIRSLRLRASLVTLDEEPSRRLLSLRVPEILTSPFPEASRVVPRVEALSASENGSDSHRVSKVNGNRWPACAALQKLNFAPNCISRGFFALKMRPKFAVPKIRFGRSKFVVLSALKTSHRSSS